MKPLNQHRDLHQDYRMYLPFAEGWEAHVKIGWDKQYCYSKNPQEDFFHLILNGEIYLQNGNEKYCLNCAMRQGVSTSERLNWQTSAASTLKSKG